MELTAERLRELLSYDSESGIWTWLKPNRGSVKAGSIAGSTNTKGYRQIEIDGGRYASNKLAFLFMKGEWPPLDMDLDHKDRNPGNDAWQNLRLATRQQHAANRKTFSNNASGFKGVTRQRRGFYKWQARITVNGKTKCLGTFGPSDAYAAYVKAAKEIFGEYAYVESEMKIAA
jgi:hypothetical protein